MKKKNQDSHRHFFSISSPEFFFFQFFVDAVFLQKVGGGKREVNLFKKENKTEGNTSTRDG